MAGVGGLAYQLNKVICGDFNETAEEISAESIDLIMVDPPYAKKYFYTYEYLAKHSARLLKDGGSLLSVIPHFSLPRVIDVMNSSGLKYRWLYVQDQESGSHPRMAMGVEVCYKPIGHWVKRAFPSGKGFLRDKVPSNPPEKLHHVWEQDLAPYLYYIDKLCPPGGTVLDPYCGSGTTLVAANLLGRNYIGVEIDPDMAIVSRIRLKKGKA